MCSPHTQASPGPNLLHIRPSKTRQECKRSSTVELKPEQERARGHARIHAPPHAREPESGSHVTRWRPPRNYRQAQAARFTAGSSRPNRSPSTNGKGWITVCAMTPTWSPSRTRTRTLSSARRARVARVHAWQTRARKKRVRVELYHTGSILEPCLRGVTIRGRNKDQDSNSDPSVKMFSLGAPQLCVYKPAENRTTSIASVSVVKRLGFQPKVTKWNDVKY